MSGQAELNLTLLLRALDESGTANYAVLVRGEGAGDAIRQALELMTVDEVTELAERINKLTPEAAKRLARVLSRSGPEAWLQQLRQPQAEPAGGGCSSALLLVMAAVAGPLLIRLALGPWIAP
jgi:hypothetical protein